MIVGRISRRSRRFRSTKLNEYFLSFSVRPIAVAVQSLTPPDPLSQFNDVATRQLTALLALLSPDRVRQVFGNYVEDG